MFAICGPGNATELGRGGRPVAFVPVEEVGRAIGPCKLVGVNAYLGVGLAHTPFGGGAGAATGCCSASAGTGAARCKNAGRRETGEPARVMVTFVPSRLEIWSKDGRDLTVGRVCFWRGGAGKPCTWRDCFKLPVKAANASASFRARARKSTCSTRTVRGSVSLSRVSNIANGEISPGDGKVKWNTAGDSGGVTGSDAAVGEGRASIFDRNKLRRSTTKVCQ